MTLTAFNFLVQRPYTIVFYLLWTFEIISELLYYIAMELIDCLNISLFPTSLIHYA